MVFLIMTRKTNAEATIVEDHQNQAKLESELYGSGVGMIPVASKAIRGLGSSAYSAYKGVRRMTTMMTTGRTMTTMTHRDISLY
jgi:hypothetical protein